MTETGPILEGWAEVAVYPDDGALWAHGLVVLAMGRPYWAEPCEAGLRLLVPETAIAAVREQLDLFDRESSRWPPAPPSAAIRADRPRWGLPLLWALLVVTVFWMRETRRGFLEMHGAMDGAAVLHAGEWWRPFTALFLHGDIGHLFSNVAAGVFVFAMLGPVLGVLRGWLLLFLASMAGNVTAAMLHGIDGYHSLGASTAIFAGIGLLTGRAVGGVVFDAGRIRFRLVLVPAFAGFCLLALMGSGDFTTDVVAHGTGFSWGVVAALAVAAWDARRPGASILAGSGFRR